MEIIHLNVLSMKIIPKNPSLCFVVVHFLALFAICKFPSTMFAENESAILLTNIAAWRNVSNVSEVIHALPEIEGLWPREPEMSLQVPD